ncbi:hypothetical protein [Polaromonas sp. A23]|uniref:hypothetical protein n=1 Tax=Polaromonas sp. A23 TaxID=1944133 RepID=UPI000986C09D|nr:hypothetical protein [Polaromonas sp. A23]OOG36700.1 hypothetical protein B0B52_20620 [Polaromonas sp. A23]
MNEKIGELIERVRQLEEDMEQELRRRRLALNADFEDRRIRFEQEVLEQQRRFKIGLAAYILGADWRHAVSAPVIYSLIFPLLILDLFLIIYQYTCFPLYGITRIRRRDYLVFDRTHLAYLNLLEKINCAYCSYASGLAAYLREVVGRTEQYWCPIKHARRVLHAHPYYSNFTDYGDAPAYREGLQALRSGLAALDTHEKK